MSMDWTPDDVRDGADAIERFGFDGDRNDAIDLSQYLLAAVAPQIAARARGHWWITDGPLRLAKSTKLLGPFPTQDLALIVRTYVERCEGHNRLWVDEEAVTGADSRRRCGVANPERHAVDHHHHV